MSRRSHGVQLANAHTADLKTYQVPFIGQGHINMCGDACVNMLLKANHKEPKVAMTASKRHEGAMKLSQNPRGVFQGAETEDLVRVLYSEDLNPYIISSNEGRFTSGQIYGILSDVGPIIASVAFSSFCGHYILITGAERTRQPTDRLFYHDPWRGANMSMTITEFNGICNGRQQDVFLTAAPGNVNIEALQASRLTVTPAKYPD
jgi:hypothetical protein